MKTIGRICDSLGWKQVEHNTINWPFYNGLGAEIWISQGKLLHYFFQRFLNYFGPMYPSPPKKTISWKILLILYIMCTFIGFCFFEAGCYHFQLKLQETFVGVQIFMTVYSGWCRIDYVIGVGGGEDVISLTCILCKYYKRKFWVVIGVAPPPPFFFTLILLLHNDW